ncbi:unnamed protein product [Withania somnifera]
MAISDSVLGNLTTLYLLVIVAIKAYGLMTGKSYSGFFVLIFSTIVVVGALIMSLTWDVSRKATRYALTREHHHQQDPSQHPRPHSDELCRGGICWHGVAVRSPASQFRFRLPHHQPR